MLNIALPKGRLGDKVYRLFAAIGFPCEQMLEDNRLLVFENPEKQVRYFLVKPSDVAIYVERGAADIGVAGKDTLLESGADVYELLDLGLGKCVIAVAAPAGYSENRGATLRVATKYRNIARGHYAAKSRDIEMIKLHGSIELAPILGLSDVIVDIVETGNTLRENNLRILEEIMPISARLIANHASYKFKSQQIDELTTAIKKETLK